MNFGMLGFAHVHAAGYAELLLAESDFTLAGIYDHDQNRLQDAVSEYGGQAYTDVSVCLSRSDIDAVIVMSETSHHAELVLSAAQAGKHVLCEKPLTTNRDDAIRIVEGCRELDVKLGTILPMRYNTAIAAARQAIAAGEIGRTGAVSGTNNGRMPPGWFQDPHLAGGGALMDHVVHLADLYRWIFDTEIVEVYAETGTRLTPGLRVEDIGVVMLRMANGMTGSIDCSWNRPDSWPTWGGLTLEVIGDQGVIEIDAFAEQIRLADDVSGRFSFVRWGEDADRALLRGFVDAIQQDQEPPVNGIDGLRALDVALCAYKSANTHEPVFCAM